MLLLRGSLSKHSKTVASRVSKRGQPCRTLATSDEPLVKTALNTLHKQLGGDMVPFAGYELPVLYKGDNGGVMKEHLWCRADGKCSLFDVSHMDEMTGEENSERDTRSPPRHMSRTQPRSPTEFVFTSIKRGYVLWNSEVNGATKFGDMKHFQEQLDQFDGDVTMEYLEDSMQLLAIQGPGAAAAVSKLLPDAFDLERMAFMTGTNTTLDGIDGCRITRCGYTGEDGFEIAMPAENAESIAAKLLEDETVNPTGLGARDSLRLEAGLCLYG
ncbi:hypothetical protein THAOC_17688, partial [Thalassiosira oceanica]